MRAGRRRMTRARGSWTTRFNRRRGSVKLVAQVRCYVFVENKQASPRFVCLPLPGKAKLFCQIHDRGYAYGLSLTKSAERWPQYG